MRITIESTEIQEIEREWDADGKLVHIILDMGPDGSIEADVPLGEIFKKVVGDYASGSTT